MDIKLEGFTFLFAGLFPLLFGGLFAFAGANIIWSIFTKSPNSSYNWQDVQGKIIKYEAILDEDFQNYERTLKLGLPLGDRALGKTRIWTKIRAIVQLPDGTLVSSFPGEVSPMQIVQPDNIDFPNFIRDIQNIASAQAAQKLPLGSYQKVKAPDRRVKQKLNENPQNTPEPWQIPTAATGFHLPKPLAFLLGVALLVIGGFILRGAFGFFSVGIMDLHQQI